MLLSSLLLHSASNVLLLCNSLHIIASANPFPITPPPPPLSPPPPLQVEILKTNGRASGEAVV
jgi:hypothetical protein